MRITAVLFFDMELKCKSEAMVRVSESSETAPFACAVSAMVCHVSF